MSQFEKEPDTASIPSLIETDGGVEEGSTMYKYRDYSNVDPEQMEKEDQGLAQSPPPPSSKGSETSIRVQKFPVKLYAILAQKEFNDIITWMPHGRSWKVLRPNLFESMVMPLFFEYSNYHSFNRLVNAWSFRRISSGPDRGSYYHELFLRGKPDLQKYMRRLPKTHKKIPMKKEDEPDFRAMDKTNPLPQLDDSMSIAGKSNGLGLNKFRQQKHPQPNMPGNMSMGLGQGMGNMSMGLSQGMGGLSAFESRDPLLGMMTQQRLAGSPSSLAGPGMGLNMMNSMGASRMGGMGSFTGLGGMGGLGGLGGFSGMNHMNTLNGMNALRDSSSTTTSTLDSGVDNSSSTDLQLQRLRQLQQMQQRLELQGMGMSGFGGLGPDPSLSSMNLMMGRQHC